MRSRPLLLRGVDATPSTNLAETDTLRDGLSVDEGTDVTAPGDPRARRAAPATAWLSPPLQTRRLESCGGGLAGRRTPRFSKSPAVAGPKSLAMASIRKEIEIHARPEDAWAAVRDVGALHTRLVPGFVTDVRLEEGARVVTFGNGVVARELIVTIDDEARRLVWAAVGGRMTHHNASAQVFGEGEKLCRFVRRRPRPTSALVAFMMPQSLLPSRSPPARLLLPTRPDGTRKISSRLRGTARSTYVLAGRASLFAPRSNRTVRRPLGAPQHQSTPSVGRCASTPAGLASWPEPCASGPVACSRRGWHISAQTSPSPSSSWWQADYSAASLPEGSSQRLQEAGPDLRQRFIEPISGQHQLPRQESRRGSGRAPLPRPRERRLAPAPRALRCPARRRRASCRRD